MQRRLFALLAILMLTGLAYSSRVSGMVWDAVRMAPGEGMAVEINTTPMQREITGSGGAYFFELEPGAYEIVVKKINQKHELEQVASQGIVVSREGNYTLDLLAFYSDIRVPDLGNDSEFEVPSIPDQSKANPQKPDNLFIILLAAVFLVLTLLIGTYYLFGKMKGGPEFKKGSKEPGPTGEKSESEKEEIGEERTGPESQKPGPVSRAEQHFLQKKEKLPSDLRQVIRIMKRSEGRMTQKDLRKEIPLSEAKVSLMLTDLESRGLIKRIKQGRGNILILKDDNGR